MNEELMEELYGFDFEVYKIEHLNECSENVIKSFSDIEKAFKNVDKTTKIICELITRSYPNSIITIETNEFGSVVSKDGVIHTSILIRELKKENVTSQ